MKATHVIVKGRVQGVWFRDYTCRQALSYNLTGWVRNLPDGNVETLLCGAGEKIKVMIEWLHTGSPMSRVDGLVVREIEMDEEYSTFEVRY